jgi:ABC-type branched-subunit amino acid transport system substrate-binding protein
VQNFVKNYQTKFGAIPDGLAALGYDAAGCCFAAMEQAAVARRQGARAAHQLDEGLRRRHRQDHDRPASGTPASRPSSSR